MATRQVEESDFLNAQAVVAAVNKMLGDKDARKLLLQARKKIEPNAVIPEIDAAEPVNAELAELKKIANDLKAEREAEKAEREQQAKLAEFTRGWEKQKSLLRSQGWRDEGIDQIEKHAQERGIPDLEVAAAHWEKLHPPAEPIQPNGVGSWGFFEQNPEDDAFIKAMIASKGDDEGALDREIRATLKDVRSQARGGR